MNLELIGRTWDLLTDKHKQLIRAFYQRFFENFPEYRPLFSNMEQQMGRMVESMALLARVADEPEVIHPHLQKLRESHRQYYLSQEDLENFKSIFVEVISEFCGQYWNQAYQEAWDEFFEQIIIPEMVPSAESTQPQLAIAQQRPHQPSHTSINNQLTGTVIRIKPRVYHGEVTLALADGTRIFAILTLENINRLKLIESHQVYILIHDTQLILTPVKTRLKFSATNRLCGEVVAIEQAQFTAEVILKLATGEYLKALVPNDALSDLAIEVEESLGMVFKATHVVLAVEE